MMYLTLTLGSVAHATGGGRGIRTPGGFRHSGFQDRRLRPLGQPSARGVMEQKPDPVGRRYDPAPSRAPDRQRHVTMHAHFSSDSSESPSSSPSWPRRTSSKTFSSTKIGAPVCTAMAIASLGRESTSILLPSCTRMSFA